MTVCREKMALSFGNAGNLNLNLDRTVFKLMVVLTTGKLLINSLTILAKHTPVTMPAVQQTCTLSTYALETNTRVLPLITDFTVEMVSNAIVKLKRGKAVDLDNFTAEHFHYCHPIIATILCKLFNLILSSGRVPAAFGHSYTVPISKIKESSTKALTTSDFRGIAISSVISKIFEHCIMDRFSHFLVTADNQVGFKKDL